MISPEQSLPLHETMLGMLYAARRRGLGHEEHSLAVCELLLQIHTPAGELLGEPCASCREPWPCQTVLVILGGLVPATTGPGPEYARRF